jgi:hypothetical protein
VIDVQDYLIEQAGKDWAGLLSGWVEMLPSSFTVWLVNKFGDVIAVFDDGSVHLLDIGACALKRVSASREEFIALIDVDDNANDWLMIPLVDQCVAASMCLGVDQCYGFKIPPLLGGGYDVGNVAAISLSEHYSCLANLYHQSKDLPDGSKVRIVVKNA